MPEPMSMPGTLRQVIVILPRWRWPHPGTISRLDANTGTTMDIAVDLNAILKSGDCGKDIWLQWGDEVDIPELDHRVNVPWAGMPQEINETLNTCLSRFVQIIVKGQTNIF